MENSGLWQNQPNLSSSQVPNLLKKYLKCFIFIFFKETSTTIIHLHFWIVLTAVVLFISSWGQVGMTNVSDSGFSRVTETLREQIRVNQPLQEQECADNTGWACSANVLCRNPTLDDFSNDAHWLCVQYSLVEQNVRNYWFLRKGSTTGS